MTATVTQTRTKTADIAPASTSPPSSLHPNFVHRASSLLRTSAVPSHPNATFYLTPTTSSTPHYTARDPTAREFTWAHTEEPHSERRRVILSKHPEITQLYGTDSITFPIVVSIAVVQMVMAYYMQWVSWPVLFICSWVVSATLNHSLQTAVHELSHNLCWEAPIANKWTAIFCNLTTAFPSSVSFQRYHFDHHHSLGVDEIDPDVPTYAEVGIFVNSLMKCFWLTLQPIFYAFRPTIVRPKSFGKWEAINFSICIAFDLLVLHYGGIKPLAYFILGTLLGLGLHPAAAHLIAEHYETISGQETYSYYGPANWLNFNVGYHNEHHDFPRIPWTRLPELTRLAPEYYLALPYYTSYLAVLWAYITDNDLGPHARIKRVNKDKVKATSSLLTHDGGAKALRSANWGRQWGSLMWIGILIAWAAAILGYSLHYVYFQ